MTTVVAIRQGKGQLYGSRARGAIRNGRNPAQINASIGFSVRSATVADAANRRLAKRKITKDERLALAEMASMLADLSGEIAGGKAQARRASGRRSAFMNLDPIACGYILSQRPSTADTQEAVRGLQQLAEDIRIVTEWEHPDREAALRVAHVFSDFAEELLASVSIPAETRRVLS